MSSGNEKDLTPDNNYASVDLTGDSVGLPPDAEDVILVVEGDSSISGTVNVELEHSNDNVNFTTAKNKPLGTGAGTPAPTFTLVPASGSIDEGSTLNIAFNTTDFPYVGTFYWRVDHITSSAADFVAASGTVVVTNNTGNIPIQVVSDINTEGGETFTVTVASDAGFTTILDTTSTITINDTSTTPLFPNHFAIAANASESGIDLGAYSGAMDIFGTGSSTPSTFSVSFWAKVSDTNSSGNRITAVRLEGEANGYYRSMDYDFIGNNLYVGGTGAPVASIQESMPSGVTVTNWNHYVIVYDTGTSSSNRNVTIYVNGIQGSTSLLSNTYWYPALGTTTNKSIKICGRYIQYGTFQYNTPTAGNQGTGVSIDKSVAVDELSTWTTALTSTQVSNLYNAGVPTDLSSESNINHWFRMGDDANDTATSIACAFHPTSTLTSSLDYRLPLTSADPISLQLPLTNTKTVGTNVSNTGVDLGIYQGEMDPAKLGAYTSSDVAQWTISFWAKTANASDIAQKGVAVRTFGQSSSNNYEATDIQLSSSQILIGGTRTATHFKNATVPGGTGDWHHYVVRWSTGGSWLYKVIDIYIDGVIQGSGTSVYLNFWLDMWSNTTNKTIAVCGRYNSISTNYPWGSQGTGTSYDIELYVDELSFWDTALTQSQIENLSRSGKPSDLTGMTNLARWFRFGDFASDTGTSIVDTQNTSEDLTGSTDYRVTLTSSDSIKEP